MSFSKGKFIILSHNTRDTQLQSILKDGTLYSAESFFLKNKQYIKQFGGSDKWVYLTGYCSKDFMVENLFHTNNPYDIKIFMCSTILNNVDNYYLNKGWYFGNIDRKTLKKEEIENWIKKKQSCGGAEILIPDKLQFDKYLIAIVVYNPLIYKQLLKEIPEKYKKYLVLVDSFVKIVKSHI